MKKMIENEKSNLIDICVKKMYNNKLFIYYYIYIG